MKTFAVAVLVACFVSSFGKDEAVNPLEEKPIDGESDVQPDDIKLKIAEALKSEDGVRLSVNSIAAERAFLYPDDTKPLPEHIDTCPTRLRYITSLVYVGPNQKEQCYVVSPERQRVTYALCGGTGCYGNPHCKSQCVRSGLTRLQFWVWCPNCGFKLIARWYPQCCSCYTRFPCLTYGGGDLVKV
ncbi:uncharacterized protein [Magallana gigas]|uniref:Uncharacterized protein n=1 Tax=Magallana gigas TaxID=29159 RepID=A0A8W8MJD4_MAGGI|nr:uncharacterized protein LOC105328910 [Crassostrea gigas]|eukprot:XP_011428252.1 PREDICTED: uncharacterized protein LOC105328910 [Crassostrea gigas]